MTNLNNGTLFSELSKKENKATTFPQATSELIPTENGLNIDTYVKEVTVLASNLQDEYHSEDSDIKNFFEDSGSEYQPSEKEDTESENISNMSNESTSCDGEDPNRQRPTQKETDNIPTDSNLDGRKGNKRKSKGQGNPKLWKRSKQAELRLHGKAYTGFKKDKSGVYKQNTSKEMRRIGNKCSGHHQKLAKSGKGGPRQGFQCSDISDVQREYLFEEFWKLNSWEAKKSFVKGLVVPVTPKYRRTATNKEKLKRFTLKYHLIVNNQELAANGNTKSRKLVCKAMFLATLNIGEKTEQNWVTEKSSNTNQGIKSSNESLQHNESCSINVEAFLLSLPQVESHYCRSSSTKLYLEPVWDSYRHVYKIYNEKRQEEGKKAASWTTFFKIFKKLNLEIWTPKKDQCNTCSGYKNGSVAEETFQAHVLRKSKAREEKEKDKTECQENEKTLAFAVDLQAVLLAPRLNAAANYYKTKLKVHKWTYYNLKTKAVTRFVWHEAQAGLESDVFASIATKFVNQQIEKHRPSKIIFWSDGCSYQNRNVKLSNALLDISKKFSVEIEQKYLEVGHTQMEVDSAHSLIERKMGRRKEIYLPSDYLRIMREARQNPFPYEVFELTHLDFFKFGTKFYSSIRPGRKPGDPVVTDICALHCDPNGVISYKLNFSEAWKDLPQRQRASVSSDEYQRLYDGPCPIEASKFAHLQELKEFIPLDCRLFYENLLHN